MSDRAHQAFADLAPEALPLALAEAHRAGVPGTTETLDLPTLDPARLDDVLTGAGFALVRHEGGRVRVVRERTLPDTVGADLSVLVCGLNPSLHAADAGVGFVSPSNRFWPAALTSGLVTVDRDPIHALRHHGVGMTDMVKRATTKASEVGPDEFRTGVARLGRLVTWLAPAVLCVVGLAGWRVAVDRSATPGWQDGPFGGVAVYLLPSTSGLNASSQLPDFVEHLGAVSAGPGRR